MSKELHPYLIHFNSSRICRFLIIGTFPPNKEERQNKTTFINYFYGNTGSLWSILNETNLFPKNSFKDFESIRAWEKKYSIGVTDVLKSCDRKDGKRKSSDDTDLVITKDDLNTSLKDYLTTHINDIKLLNFTSSSTAAGSNSAFYWLIQLMGGAFVAKHKAKLVTNLPSPSGRYLTSKAIFSNDVSLNGLNKNFLQFLKENQFTDAINIAKQTFAAKQVKVKHAIAQGKKTSSVKQVRFLDADQDYPSLYRIEQYKKAFMPVKENSQ